jgi:hypothetical protein
MGEANQKGTVPATGQLYTMAWRYMNYNANEFYSVWTKVVLPTIKSEMNLQRSRYAMAIKN